MTQERLTYKDEIIETPDNKLWIYSDKYHEWIDVTKPKGLKIPKPIR